MQNKRSRAKKDRVICKFLNRLAMNINVLVALSSHTFEFYFYQFLLELYLLNLLYRLSEIIYPHIKNVSFLLRQAFLFRFLLQKKKRKKKNVVSKMTCVLI